MIYHDDIEECTFLDSKAFNKILIPFTDVIGTEKKGKLILSFMENCVSTVLVRKCPCLDRHHHRHRLVRALDHSYDGCKIQQSIIEKF